MLRTYTAAVLLGVLSASLAGAYEAWAYRRVSEQAVAWAASPENGPLVIQRPDGALCAYEAGAARHSLRCR